MEFTKDEFARANIDNLTALWRAMGAFPTSGEDPVLAYKNLSWPHRCWFDTRNRVPTIDQVVDVLAALPAGYIVPVWEGPLAADLSKALAIEGYELSFQQTAMTLSLVGYPVDDGTAPVLKGGRRIQLQRVYTADDIRAWCDVGGGAFDYHIDPEAVSGALGTSGLDLYLALIDGDVVATGLLFQTGEIAGIHQVGVPQAFRGRGIARALMHLLLGRSVECGAARVTLQASVEGEPLYRSMNFDAQFRISNYVREA
ncbi:MAG: GNAT family N-acetyltransferase [Halieaceae bacterium]|jgi:ribosomal protein S18 acetylase RimI-like enzyme|nr:GNAT family N-acetyltransferase [Halieaceae bacterium]